MKKLDGECNITVNGQPLMDFLEQETNVEIESVRMEIVVTIGRSISKVNAPKSPRAGTGSGRTRGNPGVRKPRVLSQEEVAAENQRRGLAVVKR